jgi:hypothetical protein
MDSLQVAAVATPGRLASSFFLLGGAAISPSRIACFRASLRIRRIARISFSQISLLAFRKNGACAFP